MIELARRVAEPAQRTPTAPGLPLHLAPEQRVGRGFLFGRQDEACHRLCFIEHGHVSLRQMHRDGTHRLHEFLGPGDFFGEEALKPAGCWRVTAAAVTASTVRVMPARHLPRMAQIHPHAIASVCEQLAARMERTYLRMDLIQHASARERVYGLLTELGARYGQLHEHRIWLSLPLNQSDLADLALMRRETMARVLGTLEAEGLILRRGRRGLWLSGLV